MNKYIVYIYGSFDKIFFISSDKDMRSFGKELINRINKKGIKKIVIERR